MPKWPRWQFLKKNIRCLFGFLHSIDSQMIWFDAMSSDFFYPAANFPKLILVLREREGREWVREGERERDRVKERERGGRGSDWQFHFHHRRPLVISRKDATMLFRCFTIGVKTFDRLDTAWHPLTLFFSSIAGQQFLVQLVIVHFFPLDDRPTLLVGVNAWLSKKKKETLQRDQCFQCLFV